MGKTGAVISYLVSIMFM